MSISLVVSFHPIFVTKVDRAYSLECIYRMGEDKKIVTAQSIDVR